MLEEELQRKLTERLVKGIRKSFTPCPLIGPKWLQAYPKGRPADFRFFGIRKLAKAIGRPADRILEIVMRNVSLKGLDVEHEVVHDFLINFYIKGKPRPEPKRRRTKKRPKAPQPDRDDAQPDEAFDPVLANEPNGNVIDDPTIEPIDDRPDNWGNR